MDETLSFGDWLRRQRKARDLTRDEVARRASCSVSALRHLEADDFRPSPTLAQSLARALDLPADQHAAFIAFARDERRAPPDAKASTDTPSRAQHLPAPLTNFIGRRREVDALTDLLRNPHVRLVTLTGPPGTGKTRLSLAAGQKLVSTFRDGVFFIALESISDPNLVTAAIAQALGVNETRKSIAHALADFLCDKSVLLILDNFEHLLPAAPQMSDLLIAAPRVKALVTSRAILHLYGEHEFPVPPLELLDVQRLPTTQSLAFYSRYSAIQFFKDRARNVKPDFQLTTENAADVARICAWLDGLPLAIEIAAAQTKWHTPSQLLGQLSDRLGTLTGGPRDLTPRQQSLRGAIDWSYTLLDDDERRLFNWLGIFWGGCSEEAIAEISRQGSGVRSKIQNLVEKSLVRHELDAEGNARYTMLETMRDYARTKLAETNELEHARKSHAEYYLKFAQETNASWKKGGNQVSLLNRIKGEYNNLRAALTWTILSPVRAAMAQEFAVALFNFWSIWGLFTEGRRWVEQILALDATPSQGRTRILNCIGGFARLQGDYAGARTAHEQALTIFQSLDDDAGIYFSIDALAILAGIEENYTRAVDLLEEAANYHRRMNDTSGLVITLNNLALANRRLGNLARAKQLYGESIAMSRQMGNDKSLAHALVGQAEIYMDSGEYRVAADFVQESISIRNRQGDQRGLAVSFDELALALHSLGANIMATQLASTSDKIRNDIGFILPPKDQEENANLVAQLRANLGDKEFDRAWAKGQTMTMEQAIELAMEDSPGKSKCGED